MISKLVLSSFCAAILTACSGGGGDDDALCRGLVEESFSGNQQPNSSADVGGLEFTFRTVTIEGAEIDVECAADGLMLEEEVFVDYPGVTEFELVGAPFMVEIENVDSTASNFRIAVREHAVE